MFKKSTDRAAAKLTITLDGKSVVAHAGDSVAGAMLAAGVGVCRSTPITGAPRGPYCMMGVCFDCLVIVDGVGSRQGCMTRVSDGMRIETQHGKREIGR